MNEDLIRRENEISLLDKSVPVSIEMVPRRFRIHSISEYELDDLVAGNPTIYFGFFGICIGSLISSGIVLLTLDLTPYKSAFFYALLYVSALMGLFFGVQGTRDYLASKRKVNEIKTSNVEGVSAGGHVVRAVQQGTK